MTDPTKGAGRADPDFALCPNCGRRLRIAAEENLYGKLPVDISTNELGDLVFADWTTTEVWWDTSMTTHYFCTSCLMELPETHQRVLDVVLGNDRDANSARPMRPKVTQVEMSEAIARREDIIDVHRQALRMRGY